MLFSRIRRSIPRPEPFAFYKSSPRNSFVLLSSPVRPGEGPQHRLQIRGDSSVFALLGGGESLNRKRSSWAWSYVRPSGRKSIFFPWPATALPASGKHNKQPELEATRNAPPRRQPRIGKWRGHRDEAEVGPERPGACGREGGGAPGRSHQSCAGSQVSTLWPGRAGRNLELGHGSRKGCGGVGGASRRGAGDRGRVRPSESRLEEGRGSGAVGEWDCSPGPGLWSMREGVVAQVRVLTPLSMLLCDLRQVSEPL